MNETIKPPAAFDPVPPASPASILDLPRPLTPPPAPRPAPRQTVPLLQVPEAEYPKAQPPLPVGIAPEQPTPNPMAGSPAPKPSALSGLVWDLLRPNRAKVAVLAGVASLAAGAFGLNLLVPTGTTASSQPVKLKIPVEVKKPIAEEPKKTSAADGFHSIQAPLQPPPSVTEKPPHREPTEPGKLPPLPGLPGELPALPPLTDPNVRPASGTGASSVGAVPITPPADPVTPGLPPLPPLGTGPATPAAPPSGPVTPTFGTGEMPLPGLPGTPAPATGPKMPEPPPAPPFGAGQPPLPALPSEAPKPSALPEPGLPALPGGLPPVTAEPVKPTPTPAPIPSLPGAGTLPLPTDPVPPSPKPAPPPAPVEVKPLPLPAPVDEKPQPPQPPQPKPLAEQTPFGDPIAPTVKTTPEVKPAPLPVPPPLEPVVGAGNIAPAPVPQPKPLPVATPTARPPGATPPTPPVPAVEAKTGYDVDLHRTRAGDTYATVSKAYYGGAQYAGALQSFNRNQPINRVAEVQVPPVHVIRKYAETRAPAPAPSENQFTPTRPAADEINWGEPGSALGGQPEYTQFTVPRTGLTLRDVATTFYGSDRNWSKLNNPLNPKFGPDQELPVGTKLQVPTGNITFR